MADAGAVSGLQAVAGDYGEARKAPTIAVQPAGLVLSMNIAAQGAHTGAFIAAQRLGKLATDGWIARSSEIDEENRALESGCEMVCAGADEVRHGSGPSRRGEWKEQLA